MNFNNKNKELYQVTFRGKSENIKKLIKAVNSTPLNIEKFKMRNKRDLGLNRSRFWLPVFLLEISLDVDPINRVNRERANTLFQECLNNVEMSSLKIELLHTDNIEVKIQFSALDNYRQYLKDIAEVFGLTATVRKIDGLGFGR